MMDGQNMMNGQSMMDCMGAMGAMGWITLLFSILLLALLAWGLYRIFATSGSPAPPHETPLETLRRRYAEGEISTEEYEERKRTLSK